mgnify:CR=1
MPENTRENFLKVRQFLFLTARDKKGFGLKKFLEKKFAALGIPPAEKARLSLQRGLNGGL